MFAFIRHAGYDIRSGALTEEGKLRAKAFALMLRERGNGWKEIRTSPATRTKMTAEILGDVLQLPVEVDSRIGMEGNIVDLLPPTEPHDIIFITHLPILTKILRAWSSIFDKEEPPMVDICSGYIINTEQKELVRIEPKEVRSDAP